MIDAAAYSRAKRRAVSESWTQKLDVDAFLARAGLANEQPARPPPFVLDVRAPCEYEKGHIPGALSFPLFDDDERAVVGTLYKSKGHDVAVARGVELLDAKAPTFLDALPAGLRSGDDVLVYCKRGGMRSGGMAQLLSEGDLRVHTLQGGYQGYRAWANASWAAMGRRLVVLGGKTGSGKTAVLHALRDEHGAQITAKLPLHYRYNTVTSPLHHRYIYRHIIVTSPLHHLDQARRSLTSREWRTTEAR